MGISPPTLSTTILQKVEATNAVLGSYVLNGPAVKDTTAYATLPRLLQHHTTPRDLLHLDGSYKIDSRLVSSIRARRLSSIKPPVLYRLLFASLANFHTLL